MDAPTIILSGVVSLAAAGVAAGATLFVSSSERKAAVARDEKQRVAQWDLFRRTLAREETERFKADTRLLEAVLAELQFNLTLPNRVRVNRAFVLFEMDVLKSATGLIGALDFDTRVELQEARYKMAAYNALAMAVNSRQPGVSIANEPQLNPDDLPNLAEAARLGIDMARAKLEVAIKGRRGLHGS